MMQMPLAKLRQLMYNMPRRPVVCPGRRSPAVLRFGEREVPGMTN